MDNEGCIINHKMGCKQIKRKLKFIYMKKYEIWIEGYSATGEHEGAERLLREGEQDSKWEAMDFKQACVKALNELKWPMLSEMSQGLGSCLYNKSENSYWARRFFDNEADARKSFR